MDLIQQFPLENRVDKQFSAGLVRAVTPFGMLEVYSYKVPGLVWTMTIAGREGGMEGRREDGGEQGRDKGGT